MKVIDKEALEAEFTRIGLLVSNNDSACQAAYIVNRFPTIDAAPVVHGRWEEDREIVGLLMCSQCGYIDHRTTNDYCPSCGAKMDKEEPT